MSIVELFNNLDPVSELNEFFTALLKVVEVIFHKFEEELSIYIIVSL